MRMDTQGGHVRRILWHGIRCRTLNGFYVNTVRKMGRKDRWVYCEDAVSAHETTGHLVKSSKAVRRCERERAASGAPKLSGAAHRSQSGTRCAKAGA